MKNTITLPSLPLLNSFISSLKRHEIDGINRISLSTCTVLKSFLEITYNNYISACNNKIDFLSIGEFIEQLRFIGKKLTDARPIGIKNINLLYYYIRIISR